MTVPARRPYLLRYERGPFYLGIGGPIYRVHVGIGRLSIMWERKRPPKKVVKVTRTQVMAAKEMVRRLEKQGEPVPESYRKIADVSSRIVQEVRS